MGAIGITLFAALLYYLSVQLTIKLSGLALDSGNYNSLTNAIEVFKGGLLRRFVNSYTGIVKWLGYQVLADGPRKGMLIANGGFFLLMGIGLLRMLLDRRMNITSKLMFVLLGLSIPFVGNLAHFLSGSSHILMLYAYCLLYMMGMAVMDDRMMLTEPSKKPRMRALRAVAAALLMVILLGNVRISNAMYLKKDLERQGTLSMMTRVVERMDTTDGYVPGETPLVIIGSVEQIRPGFEDLGIITGMRRNQQLTYPETVEHYFEYVLNEAVRVCTEEEYLKLCADEALMREIPVFPEAGSVGMHDGLMIVRLS